MHIIHTNFDIILCIPYYDDIHVNGIYTLQHDYSYPYPRLPSKCSNRQRNLREIKNSNKGGRRRERTIEDADTTEGKYVIY